MPSAPYVELRARDLGPQAIQQLSDKTLGDPSEVLQSALMSYRLLVINKVKSELTANVDAGMLMRLLDGAASLYLGRFTGIAGPMAAASYMNAYRQAKAGEVPISMVYALAEEHTQRIGRYYNQTNQEAILQGFNFLVNQKVPARVAAERVMDAYGLTPRQMSGYVATKGPGAVASKAGLTRLVREKALNYISKSLRSRFKVFAEQEAHNLDQQAKQTAWLWMSQHGILTGEAKKVWITAKDEKVCPACGPMHNKRVAVTEKFKLPTGEEVYVPGLHPNCRCDVRVIDPGAIRKADDWEEHEHPRANNGRFTVKARTQTLPKPKTNFRPTTGDHPFDVVTADPFDLAVDAPTTFDVAASAPVGSAFDVAAPEKTFDVAPAAMADVQYDVGAMLETNEGVQLLLETEVLQEQALDIAAEISVKPEPKVKPKLFQGYRSAEQAAAVLPVETHYAVMGRGTGMGGKFNFSGQRFHTDYEKAIGEHVAIREMQIQEILGEQTVDRQFDARFQTHDGEVGSVSPYDLEHILRRTAESVSRGEPTDGYVYVDVYDRESDRNGLSSEDAYIQGYDPHGSDPIRQDKMSYEQVLQELGIEPSQLELKIVELDAVHENDRGKGEHQWQQNPTGEWMVLSGEYELSERPRDRTIDGGTKHGESYRIFPVYPANPDVINMQSPDIEPEND